MRWLVQAFFFLVLAANSATLLRIVGPFHVYTVDLALAPFFVLSFLWIVRDRSASARPDMTDLAVIVTTFLMFVSFAVSDDRMQSLMNTMDWVRLSAFYFVIRRLSGRVITERMLIRQFSALAFLLVGLGLIQMVTGKPIGLVANYFGYDVAQEGWSPVAGYGAKFRISGPTPNSNVFAMWVILYGGLGLAAALARGRFVLFSLAALGIPFVLLGTLSRGGVAGFAAFFAVLIWKRRDLLLLPRVGLPVAASLGAGVLLLVAVGATGARSSLANSYQVFFARQAIASGSNVRSQLIEAGVELLKDPKVLLVGCGADNMVASLVSRTRSTAALALEGAISSGFDLRTGVHNVWMRTAVENGIFAALALVWVFVGFVRRARRYGGDDSADARLWRSYLVAIAVWYLAIASQVYLMAARLPVLLPLFAVIAFAVSGRPAPAPRPGADGPLTEESEAV